MKILQVINAYYPPYSSGGAAFVAHNISEALAKRGNEVTVYTTNALSRDRLFDPGQNPHHDDGVMVHYLKNMVYKPSIQIYFSKQLVEIFKKNVVKYDIVHLHEYRSYISILASHYAQRYGVPYVLQAHGSLPRIMEKQTLKWLFDVFCGYGLLKNASKVITVTRTEAQQCLSMGVPKELIEVIPNGIDLSDYANLPPKGCFKKKFGIAKDKKIVLYLGRINRIKGADFLAKAYSRLIRNEKYQDAKLVIAGPDDGYLGELRALIKALKIENDVLIPGALYEKDKLEAYVDADVYVLPSRYEIWGLTVLEAYACGKPVIASKVGGLRDLVVDGNTGFLVEPDNVGELADAIRAILSNDNRARQMGSMGRSFVKENFGVQKTTEELELLYEEVLHDAHDVSDRRALIDVRQPKSSLCKDV